MKIVVIGAGLVGLATAWRLQMALPDAELIVLEKETTVGRHQSGNNSGVLHAGLYYKPGSLKAQLAVLGIREMTRFCGIHDIRHEVCGKLVVATDEPERARLQMLHERGLANGLRGLRLLTIEQAREMEPHIRGVAALHVPEEGIVDYRAVSQKLADLVAGAGGVIRTGSELINAAMHDRKWRCKTTGGEITADIIVGCAGLHADRVAALTGSPTDVRIIPFRGDYFYLKQNRTSLVNHLIYPVPNPAFPFLGVHFTRRTNGHIEAGPNAVLSLAREGYKRGSVSLRDAAESLGYPGLWRFVFRHFGPTVGELANSFIKAKFVAELRRLVPDIQGDDLERGSAGVRAQAMTRDGRLVEDFHFVEGPRSVHVINAPSPGATASLVIGENIAARVIKQLAA